MLSYRFKRTRHETRVYNKRMKEVGSKFEEVALFEWTAPVFWLKYLKLIAYFLGLLYNEYS